MNRHLPLAVSLLSLTLLLQSCCGKLPETAPQVGSGVRRITATGTALAATPGQAQPRAGAPEQGAAAASKGDTMWKTGESITDYAGRMGLAPTTRLDLGKGVVLDLVLVPAGRFTMGSPPGEGIQGNKETQHEVTLTHPYYLGKTEVTQQQYETVEGKNPSRAQGPNRPVENLLWSHAMAFCEKASSLTGRKVRLPTEAEWEFACRAGTTSPFSFGATLGTDQANFDGTQQYDTFGHGIFRKQTTDVGSFPPNAWGLHDMHGNVREWCRDIYGTYPPGPVTDPTGADSGILRVNRGGGWKSGAQVCRSADRGMDSVIDSNDETGFRVVVEP